MQLIFVNKYLLSAYFVHSCRCFFKKAQNMKEDIIPVVAYFLLLSQTAGNVTTLRADNLMPYEYHTFIVEACTIGGCTRSSPSIAVRTFEDCKYIYYLT